MKLEMTPFTVYNWIKNIVLHSSIYSKISSYKLPRRAFSADAFF